MSLPAQVRKQIEVVEQHYQELNSPPAATEPDPQAVTQEQVSDQAPTDNPAGQAPASQPEQAAGGQTENYEQKYRTLQGMYNAEVPRLHAQNREYLTRIQQLESLIATMSSAPPTAASVPSQSFVTPEDREAYGDSIDVMKRVVREEMAGKDQKIAELEALIRQMQGTVVPRVHQLTQEAAISTEQRFWADLQTQVPDWRTINSDPAFQSWLLEIDPMTGMPRQTYLEAAQRAADVSRVVSIFSVWKGLTGATARPQRDPSTTELSLQVAPGRGRTMEPPTNTSAKTYSSEDIRKFYVDVQQGRYRDRQAEKDRIERDIFNAQREGRITA